MPPDKMTQVVLQSGALPSELKPLEDYMELLELPHDTMISEDLVNEYIHFVSYSYQYNAQIRPLPASPSSLDDADGPTLHISPRDRLLLLSRSITV